MSGKTNFEVFLDGVAEKYRRTGYRVVVNPTSRDLPRFLKEHVPDLVAKGEDENVAVGIKRLGIKKGDKDLVAVANAVDGRAGWRFDVVLYEEEEVPKGPLYLLPKSIRSANLEADTIYNQGHTAAALMLACSAFEAAAKRVIAKVEDRYAYKLGPNDLVKRLVFHGFLTEGEFETVQKVIVRRNQIAHGRLKRPVPKKMLDGIRKLTERLLERREAEFA